MSVPKRISPGYFHREKSSIKSLNNSLDSISLTTRFSLSQTTDYPSKGWYRYESTRENKEAPINPRSPLRFERRTDIQTRSKSMNRKGTETTAEQTQVSDDEEWVCPVAVALRRAGYNVPLRPSKSWLERDRKTQALLLQEKRTSSKGT